VVFASSLGTVFEWYDFYLYATLAPFFAALFFPQGTTRPRCFAAFATYAAGFLVRPFGAIVFGRSAISSAANTPSSSPSW
jgi:MFS family permease